MQHQDRSGETEVAVAAFALETEALCPSPTPVTRRRFVRALSGIAVGAVVLFGLAGCGGEDGEDDEDDD